MERYIIIVLYTFAGFMVGMILVHLYGEVLFLNDMKSIGLFTGIGYIIGNLVARKGA